MFGYPCSLNAIANLCKKYNAFLIEDAAQAYGLRLFSKELVKWQMQPCIVLATQR